MNKVIALFLAALTLAACGVDGAPIRPTKDAPPETADPINGAATGGKTGGG